MGFMDELNRHLTRARNAPEDIRKITDSVASQGAAIGSYSGARKGIAGALHVARAIGRVGEHVANDIVNESSKVFAGKEIPNRQAAPGYIDIETLYEYARRNPTKTKEVMDYINSLRVMAVSVQSNQYDAQTMQDYIQHTGDADAQVYFEANKSRFK